MNFRFIIIGIIILILYFYSNNITPDQLYGELIKVDNNSVQGKIYNRFFTTLLSINIKYGLKVPIPAVLAVINKESVLLFQSKSNSQVVGDNGNSIGYMQVSRPALADSNSTSKINYTFSDLSDENKNLQVGSIYLDLCYRSALAQKSSNPIKLAFKKYNGGLDETDSSINKMASDYANTAYNYYLIYKGIS